MVLAEAHADLLDEEGFQAVPEVSNFRDIPHARAWGRVSELWSQPIVNGTPRELVWDKYFAPVLKWAIKPSVYVLDQYVGKNLYERITRLPKSKSVIGDGAEWLITRLAHTDVSRVEVVTGASAICERGFDVGATRSRINEWFSSLDSSVKFDLYAVESTFEAHHRRIAIDGWLGFQIDNGLASFDGPRLSAMSLPMSPSPRIGQETRKQCEQFRRSCRLPS